MSEIRNTYDPLKNGPARTKYDKGLRVIAEGLITCIDRLMQNAETNNTTPKKRVGGWTIADSQRLAQEALQRLDNNEEVDDKMRAMIEVDYISIVERKHVQSLGATSRSA